MKNKIGFWAAGIIVLVSLILWGLTQYRYSNGVRTGRLVKISKKGILLKTYEGTLDLGSGDQLTWKFSVHDTELGESLAKQSGRKVRLEYRQLLFKLFYQTTYDVHQFSVISNYEDDPRFCKLVNIMRKNHHVVNAVKKMILNSAPNFLDELKSCQ